MRNENGFTLVELMVALFIIGVLSMIAVPNIKKYQERAKMTPIQRLEEAKKETNPIRCIEGYKFVKDFNNNLTQVLNKEGGGISCD